MQHLNYCRQLTRFLMDALAMPNMPPAQKDRCSHLIDLCKSSQKFLLPKGGRLFDDGQYRALDEHEPLRLPHPFIALEYEAEQQRPEGDGAWIGAKQGPADVRASKRICFARERDGLIVLTVVYRTDHDGMWRALPEIALPTTGYLDRNTVVDGRVSIKVGTIDNKPPSSDYGDEVGAFLCFLNVLQCANVRFEKSDPQVKGKALKRALSFDSYYVLTVGSPNERGGDGLHAVGSHRSPREHLRRGHIRRYESGVRVWVNATVVNHGVGGKITKDYRMSPEPVAA